MKEHSFLFFLFAFGWIYALVGVVYWAFGKSHFPWIYISLCVCLSLIAGIILSLDDWLRRRHESKKPCPHGIQGGQTRHQCEICNQEREEENGRREKERQESQRLQTIRAAAKALKIEEMQRLARARASKLDFILNSTPREFEDTIAAMFENLGYSVKQTPYSGDHGKDAIAIKEGKKVLIECKRYEQNNLIGRPALQKFYAAIMEEKAVKGYFVTTSGFARTAFEYDYVRSKLIELIDGKTLAHMMIKAFPEDSNSEKYRVMCQQCGQEVIFDLEAGESQKACINNHTVNNDLQSDMLSIKLVAGKVYCEKCGREMRRIRGRRGDFLGCTGYPKCRFTQSI